MNSKTKLLWIGLAIGFIGCAATLGVIIGTGTLMSREAEKAYAITEPFESIELSGPHRDITLLPSKNGSSVNAYAKAWRPEPIDLDAMLSFSVQDGALHIAETPFPDNFLGFFPQPYELRLTIYVPEDYFEQHTGGAK
ncbi:MAG: hypothetical protein ACM3S4_06475 [Burkholderiales bacterium]